MILVGQYAILKALRGNNEDRYREGYCKGFAEALQKVDNEFYVIPKPPKPRRKDHLRLVKF